MRSFVLGVVLGALAGALATYVVLEQRHAEQGDELIVAEAAESISEAVAEADRDGRKRGKKGKNRKKRGRSAGGNDIRNPDGPVEVSAADRKVIWRGAKVKLPAKDADFASGGGGRSLSSGEISSGISGQREGLARCIADARGNAELRAKITLKFLVDGDGRVGPVRVRAPGYLQKRGLLACARGVAKRANFPSTGAHTVVTLPFELDL